MKKNKGKNLTIASFLVIGLIILTQSCDIKEPTAPHWDVMLNVPIAKKEYTLKEIIEDKSEFISHYSNSSNNGLLYYSEIKSIDEVFVEDKLEIDNFYKSMSETIGTLSIETDSVITSVGPSWIGGVNAGDQTQIPPVNDYLISENFNSAEQYINAKFESGVIDISFINNFPQPVSLTITQIVIKNSATGEIIANTNQSLLIPAQQRKTAASLPINKSIYVSNKITLEARISTNGSSGQIVTIPQKTMTVIATMKNLIVSEATAKIPEQEMITLTGTIEIDEGAEQPHKFQSIKFTGGKLNVRITNNTDVDAEVSYSFPHLKYPNGNSFVGSSTLLKGQSIKLFDNYSLSNHTLTSTNGVATDKVTYQINFKVTSTDEFRTIKSTDYASGSIDFTELSIGEFIGSLRPTEVDETRSSVGFDSKDFQDKFKFSQINLRNPKIELWLKPTANVEFEIDGMIEAKSNKGQKSIMRLNSQTLNKTIITPTDSIIIINPDSVSSFFKKFTSFPDSIIIYSKGIVNPNYKAVSIKSTDSFKGLLNLELPLDIGIGGGEFSDSLEIDLSEDDRKKISDVKFLEANLKITNGMPVGFSFTGKLYDSQNRFLSYYPPKYSTQDTVINIDGAAVDVNGKVINAKDETIKMVIEKTEAQKISNAAYMRFNIKLNTSGANNAPVKFNIEDIIKINAFGSLNYTVKP